MPPTHRSKTLAGVFFASPASSSLRRQHFATDHHCGPPPVFLTRFTLAWLLLFALRWGWLKQSVPKGQRPARRQLQRVQKCLIPAETFLT